MKKQISLLVWVIVLFCSSSLYSQNPKWKVYDKDNSGLLNNDVSSITIDSQGNKWIGNGLGGLTKFDGVKWTVYNAFNSSLPITIATSNVSVITTDSQDNKWIGTFGGGVCKFIGTNWTIYNKSNSGLPDNRVSAITIDSQDNKWIGTYGGGLCKFDGSKWTLYNESNSSLPCNYITKISIDSQGNKWVGTTEGLCKFDGTNWIVYNIKNSDLSNNEIEAIIIDTHGNKWIGTWGGGLCKFDGTNWIVYNNHNSGLPANNISSIAIDLQGNKWIGTHEGGLCKFDGTNWTVYNKSNSGLPNNYLKIITIDLQGNKWIGIITGEGLTVFNENGIKGLNSHENEANNETSKTSIAPTNLVDLDIFKIPTQGLVLYYPFNGNRNDEIGNAHNESIEEETLTNDRFGNPNRAYDFNGFNHFTLENNSHFYFSITASFCAWAYFNDLDFENSNSGTNWGNDLISNICEGRSLHIGLNKSRNKITFGYSDNDAINVESKTIINPKKWYFIAGTYDGNNLNLYINGNLENNLHTIFNIGSCSYFYIGNVPSDMDDIRIYNRALTQSEITALYEEKGLDGLSYPAYISNKDKIDKEISLIKPKDEFETKEAYEKRVLNEKNIISVKYENMYNEKTKELIKTIKQSYTSQNEYKIEKVGQYNTETEEFPITINRVTHFVKIPLSEAKSFKENYVNAKVTGSKQLDGTGTKFLIFNVKITHPITGSVYLFGGQLEPLYLDQ